MPDSTPRDRVRDFVAPALIVLFTAAFFAPELFGGRIAATANMARWYPWRSDATAAQIAAPSHNPDCNLSYYPRRAVLHDAWRSKELPLWNPYAFAGAPFLADVQAGVFYPPNWVLAPFDPRHQLGVFLFLHAAWGGLGLFVLVRRAGVSPAIAALAGCAFALNGYFAKHFGQPPFLATAAWVPWLLAAALAARDRPTARGAAALGVTAALLFLAGQPQTAAHAALAVALVLAVREVASPALGGPRMRAAAAFAGGVALAGLVAAVQLLPTADLASRSARAELPYETIVSGAFHPVDAVRLVVEEFFGSPLTEDEWSGFFPRGDGFFVRHQLNSLFAGTPLFFLALFAAFGRRTWRAALPWTVLLVVAVLLAFGSPLARLAHEFVPGFGFSRIDRVGFFAIVAQCVLAAIAAQRILDDAGTGARARRRFGAGMIAVAAIGAVAVGPLATQRPLAAERTRVAAAFAGLAGIALAGPSAIVAATVPHALAAVQLAFLGAPYRGDRRAEDVFAPHESITTLRAILDEGDGGGRMMRFGRGHARALPLSNVLPPSTNVPYGLRDLQGYNALSDSTLGRTLETAFGEPVFSEGLWAGRRIVEPTGVRALEHPLLDALAVRAVVSDDRTTGAWGWTPVATPGFALLRNDEAQGRVQLHFRGRGVEPDSMAVVLRTGAFDPASEAIWIGEGTVGAADDGVGAVEVLEDRTSRIVIRTETSAPALLVVADSWSPGWIARVDGNLEPILRVWGVVRGIRVPPGSHTVELVYDAPGFRLGAALSLAGLLAAVVLGSWTTRTRGRRGS